MSTKLQRAYQGPQDSQFDELMSELTERIDGKFSEQSRTFQREISGVAQEISRLRNDVERSYQRRRLFERIDEDVRQNGGRGCGVSMEAAAQFGAMARALMFQKIAPGQVQDELQKAALNPQPGVQGGYLLGPDQAGSIIRNVETYGVMAANAEVFPVTQMSGSRPRRSQGATVYYPDLGVQATESTLKAASVRFNLTRWATLVIADRWMLSDGLQAQLGAFILTELAYALAQAEDTNGFIGDGTPAFARTVGLVNSSGPSQAADTGDDTFSEVAAGTSKYLSLALGLLPNWADDEAYWYMSRSLFWSFLGQRDSLNRPIADILFGAGQKPMLTLMGYPVRITQVMPKLSDTAVSKTLAVLANLRRGMCIHRLSSGYEILISEHVKILEGQIVFLLNALQDIVETDSSASVRIKTAAS